MDRPQHFSQNFDPGMGEKALDEGLYNARRALLADQKFTSVHCVAYHKDGRGYVQLFSADHALLMDASTIVGNILTPVTAELSRPVDIMEITRLIATSSRTLG